MPYAEREARVVAELPIADFESGEIMPPFEPQHPSWKSAARWNDPLAPWCGYRVASAKAREEHEGVPAIHVERGQDLERALITGEPTWRDYSVECRLQALQAWSGPSNDGWFIRDGRAGIAFRVETSRRFYYFCLEAQRRLVLYRRNDDEWFVLATADVVYQEQPVTLRVALTGDGMRASCPELDTEFFVTDTMFTAGRAGFRARGEARLLDLRVSMTPSQERENDRRTQVMATRTARLAAEVPDPVKTEELDLSGGLTLLESNDFAQAGRCDLLLKAPTGLLARSWDGTELWRTKEPAAYVKVDSYPEGGCRRIYALVGERAYKEKTTVRGAASRRVVADEVVAINGATGVVEARAKLPDEPDMDVLLQFDFSNETAHHQSEGALELVVRQWRRDCGGGGRDLWAYDNDLNLLWHHKVDPPYGHHNAVHIFDLNADGRPEVMAGGTLVSSEGVTLATHDLGHEMSKIRGAGHYDAVIVGDLSDDPEVDPVAFLMGGSAGVYVIDAMTGRTRASHRIGHAQWGLMCKLRDDIPGMQVLSGTRWWNYGILTLFSARGERLWTTQPDYILQGSCVMQWRSEGPQHIWLNTSVDALGLYDGYGRLVNPLDPVRKLWAGRTPMDVSSKILRRTPDGPDLMGVQLDETMHIFSPE